MSPSGILPKLGTRYLSQSRRKIIAYSVTDKIAINWTINGIAAEFNTDSGKLPLHGLRHRKSNGLSMGWQAFYGMQFIQQRSVVSANTTKQLEGVVGDDGSRLMHGRRGVR